MPSFKKAQAGNSCIYFKRIAQYSNKTNEGGLLHERSTARGGKTVTDITRERPKQNFL